MINITNNEQCCGCNACGDICPKAAITFITDNEGFLYPEVDRKKCVGCGLCEQVCPVIHADELKRNDFEEPLRYAAENKNLEVVFDSTAGGLFSAFAEFMYKHGGYVGGVIFNDDLSASQFISNDRKDLQKLRSSKYVQSDARGFYRRVQELLKCGEKVLLCGTPCQMAAMCAYLGHDHENLLTVDFTCLGVNSPLVWKKYLDSFDERYQSPVVHAKSNSKEYGWRNLTQKVILKDGRHIYETKDICSYVKCYDAGLGFRPSCNGCKFRGPERVSDITLGNFWGAKNFSTGMEKNLGTSLVMINSRKGSDYFENIKPRVNSVVVPSEIALCDKEVKLNDYDREKFFMDLRDSKFADVVGKYVALQQKGFAQRMKLLSKKCNTLLSKLKFFMKVTRMNPSSILKSIRYSGIKNLLHGRGIIFLPYCAVSISRDAKLELDGLLTIGNKRIHHSRVETRLIITEGGKLTVHGKFGIRQGSYIEINGGHLIIHGKKLEVSSGANLGCKIYCDHKIEIGNDVQIGFDVTIRDNNGHHCINRQGYRDSRPVIIEDKAWLCSGCTIMPGVRVGEGAVVGAKSFVISSVPPYSLVSGHPARVIDKNIQWKY